MTETYKLVHKDIDVIGYYGPETAKGSPENDVAYKALRGIINELTITVNDDRKEYSRPGDGPVQTDQAWNQHTVSVSIDMLLETDHIDAEDSAFSFIALALGKDSMHETTGTVLIPGTQTLTFTSGTTDLVIGKPVVGGTSTATAILKQVLITSGTLLESNAAGTLVIDNILGTFQSDEAISVGGTPACVAGGTQATVKSEQDAITLWVRQTGGLDIDHVVAGCQVKTVELAGEQDGPIRMRVELTGMLYQQDPVLGTAYLPHSSYYAGLPYMLWTSASSTLTLTRCGTEARLQSWSFKIDRGEHKFVPKAGQRYATDLCPTKCEITGNFEFFLNDTEIYTAWATDPNGTKQFNYKSQTGNFTVGLYVLGGTSGASGLVVADTDSGTTGTLTLRDIRAGQNGNFGGSEALVDTSTGAATMDGDLSDPSTVDFLFTFDGTAGIQYLKLGLYNLVPTGNLDIKVSPQSDDVVMISYPWKVLRVGNCNIVLDD